MLSLISSAGRAQWGGDGVGQVALCHCATSTCHAHAVPTPAAPCPCCSPSPPHCPRSQGPPILPHAGHPAQPHHTVRPRGWDGDTRDLPQCRQNLWKQKRGCQAGQELGSLLPPCQAAYKGPFSPQDPHPAEGCGRGQAPGAVLSQDSPQGRGMGPQDPRSTALTFALCLELLVQQVVLPVAKDEGQEGEDEGIEDADDGQDVSPAHGAVAQGVLPRLLPAHVPYGLCVPAVRKDHAAQHQAESCEGRGSHQRGQRGGSARRLAPLVGAWVQPCPSGSPHWPYSSQAAWWVTATTTLAVLGEGTGHLAAQSWSTHKWGPERLGFFKHQPQDRWFPIGFPHHRRVLPAKKVLVPRAPTPNLLAACKLLYCMVCSEQEDAREPLG